MDKIPGEYLSIIIPIITGIFGYLIREWQNHSKPFISMLGFTGGFIFSDMNLELDEKILNELDSSFYLNKLNILSELEQIQITKDNCNEVIEDSKSILKYCLEIENITNDNKDNNHLFNSLQKLFDLELTNSYILALLLNGLLNFPEDENTESRNIFKLTESSINGGAFVISYNGKPFSLGASFEEDDYYKNLFTAISKIIVTANLKEIKKITNSLKNNIRKELSIANKLSPELETIINEHSHWGCDIYIGNLKKTPFLIQNEAILYIKDKTGATFQEKCILVLDSVENDEIIRKQIDTPLVLQSGANISFSCFTKNTQKSRDRGQDFRNAFIHGEATGQLGITLNGVGLFKKWTVLTEKMKFIEF